MAQQPQHEIFQFEKAGRGNGAESALAPKGNGRPQRRPRKPSASSVTQPAKPLQTAEPAPLHIPPSLSVTSPTPRNSAYPTSPTKESDTLQLPTALKAPSAKSQGKRKAEDGDTTPPDVKRATFAPIEPRTVRISDSSQAPSSYASYQNKRARVATTPSPRESDQGHNYSSVASRASSRSRGSPEKFPARAPSRATSTRSLSQKPGSQQTSAHDRRTSLSGMSIPISALVSPHAPSVARSSKFHMQDPRKPPRARPTGWALHRRDEEEERSPVQAWLFFAGFVLFPVWWLASVMGTPETRRVGGSDVEKAVVVDDPQVERDAKAWRFRCRVMAVVSLFTYIPFIVLVAIFAPR